MRGEEDGQHSIELEHNGRMLRGSFTVWGDILTVIAGSATKNAVIGDTSAETLARSMLRELVDEGKI